jgi:hypothetical protein
MSNLRIYTSRVRNTNDTNDKLDALSRAIEELAKMIEKLPTK